MNRRKRIETDLAPASTGYRSNAMVAAGVVFTGGHIGAPVSTPENRIPPLEKFEAQIDLALEHMRTLILAGGGDLTRVVEVSAFIVPYDRLETVQARTRAFLHYDPPLFDAHHVEDVALHGMLEVDGVALADPGLSVAEATDWLRPFGHKVGLVISGPFIMLNGLTAPGATLGEQSENLFKAADRQLKQAGSTLANTVKLTVFNADYNAYPEFNQVTKIAFRDFEPPTRSVTIAPQITGTSLLRVDLLALAG